jgi:hypothetical protein
VGEVTRNRGKDVVFREIERIRVKRKEESVTIAPNAGTKPR